MRVSIARLAPFAQRTRCRTVAHIPLGISLGNLFSFDMSSIRVLARQLGLSTSTVSLALRGVGRVAPATRQKIRKAAAALNYHPNPLFSKALSFARQPPATRYRETLAFILEWPTETGPNYQKEIHAGALQQARTMGYLLQPHVVSDLPSEQRRLSNALHHQGIRGLIVFPRTRRPRLLFSWEKFAGVEIGRTLRYPRELHRIEDGLYANVVEALHLLKKAGFRRIGMAIEPMNIHYRGIYHAPYLLSQLRQKERMRIPLFAATGPWTQKNFARWIERYRPDVIFIHDFQSIYSWLTDMGLKVPRDISLFSVNARQEPLRGLVMSGLRHDNARFGRNAVEMVSLLLESGEIGLQHPQRCWSLEAFWQTGKSLRHSIAPYVSPDGRLLPGRHRNLSPNYLLPN
jgi:DNA-binding LacI/PurR family transcriptional regulator